MTENQVANQVPIQENKLNDKEINFRRIEEKHRREMAEVQAKLEEAEKKAQEALSKKQQIEDEDEDDEPYIVPKKLDKKLAKFGQNTHSEIQKAMEMAKQAAKEELKQELWLENNKDFSDVLNEDNLMKLVNKAPGMAESIKKIPDGFEKQKLVYNAIKSMGIDKPEPKQSSVQDQINANKRSPYYQPSGVGAAPYSSVGDYSPSGQKNAYNKMKELQSKLRM